MLSNSVIAAGIVSGYLTALVLQLNPSLPIDLRTLGPLILVLSIVYGANLTVAFYALIVFRQILAVEVLSPGWLSVRLLSWLCTIASGGAAAIMWMNWRAFGPVLDVNNNPANPVIGARSYSEDPALTARLGASFVRGLQDNGLQETALDDTAPNASTPLNDHGHAPR